MLLSVLLQAAAGVGISKLGAAIGAGIAVLGAGISMVKSVARLWKVLPVSPKLQAIYV